MFTNGMLQDGGDICFGELFVCLISMNFNVEGEMMRLLVNFRG